MPKRAATSVWISIDMEGLGGVAAYSHVMMQGVEYERARKWMADEANACIDGAASAGARRILVNDSHGAMHNIFADDLDPRAELVVGTAKPWSMGQGIDGGYDTCFFVGYHGRAGHPKAVLDHTYASRAIFECRLNGKPVGETTLNAYLAGHFGATVSLVSGDDATCREGRSLVPDVVTVKTKDATGRFSAKMIHPSRVQEALREGAARAVGLSKALKPLVAKGSNEIELVFLTSAMADMAELIPATRRSGARAVAYASRDYLELYKAMLAMVRIAPAAVPPEQP
ncbi:MAG: M55 family metallopeptidase [Chloroflexota bacterium]|nr:M55 family metallopeptidase [Chloroflexota bacterium]